MEAHGGTIAVTSTVGHRSTFSFTIPLGGGRAVGPGDVDGAAERCRAHADRSAARRCRDQRGDELALHGCTHRDDGAPQGWLDGLRRSHYTRGEGEFWSLSRREALARMDIGIDWFARNGWPLSGFVAPASMR